MLCADIGACADTDSGPVPYSDTSLVQQPLVSQAVKSAAGELFASLSALGAVPAPAPVYPPDIGPCIPRLAPVPAAI